MKRSTWLLLAVFPGILMLPVFSCSRGTPPKTAEEMEREQMEKNGIKSITKTKAAFFAGVRQPDQVTQVKEYNRQGLLVKQMDFRSDGTAECILGYAYNSNDQLTSYTAVNADNEFLYKVTKSYHANHQLKELYFYLPGGSYKYRTEATYDNKGRLSEYAWYWTTGFKARNIYTYHGWNIISDKEYDPQGLLNYEWTYKYDRDGNQLEAIQVNQQGKISRRISSTFDGSRLMKQTSYIDEAIEKIAGYKYNENGLLNEVSEYNSSGKIAAIHTYQYEHWK